MRNNTHLTFENESIDELQNISNDGCEYGINYLERFVKNKIKKLRKMKDGISDEIANEIMTEFYKRRLRVYLHNYGLLPRFMVNYGELHKLDNLESELREEIKLAKERYKKENRRINIEKLSVNINFNLFKL
ncbi:hypothetical protein JH146_0963 [Methanocaldococcus bathoardescens]|uniref:Uncharacterized protein n=1 Tax=Methanocaldococcus bathoardescens TaxID=1301915 RepID=A0A076LH83_9EURY|nr:hypothetical protein [Methanocaldococcus bathoardescens]AIJ05808.1 hypothetical protein JH146_0963 [Methanocaldococcus bathoardescens]